MLAVYMPYLAMLYDEKCIGYKNGGAGGPSYVIRCEMYRLRKRMDR